MLLLLFLLFSLPNISLLLETDCAVPGSCLYAKHVALKSAVNQASSLMPHLIETMHWYIFGNFSGVETVNSAPKKIPWVVLSTVEERGQRQWSWQREAERSEGLKLCLGSAWVSDPNASQTSRTPALHLVTWVVHKFLLPKLIQCGLTVLEPKRVGYKHNCFTFLFLHMMLPPKLVT